METLFVPERMDRIAELLKSQGRVTVEELANVLKVSDATVRRDLKQMQQRGAVTRTRGGALLNGQVPFDRYISESQMLDYSIYEEIGRLAASLIGPGDTVIVDADTAMYKVVQQVSASQVTIVTNGLDIVSALIPKPDIEVVVIGGLLHRFGGTTTGPAAVRELGGLVAGKAILGVNAISVSRGISMTNALLAEIKQIMIRQSKEVIVVADHNKFSAVAPYEVAPIDAIDKIVTDNQATEEQIKPFIDLGIEVLLAD